MGLSISNVFTRLFGKKQIRLLMIGLDGAGKTTILLRLKLGEVVTTIPTVGFNVETAEYKNIKFTIWDIGGGDKIKPLWVHYYMETQGIIFVVDSSETMRISEAGEALATLLGRDELKEAVVLVIANKQDKSNVMTTRKVAKAMNLEQLKTNRWHVQAASAIQGQGIYEGLDWISIELDKK